MTQSSILANSSEPRRELLYSSNMDGGQLAHLVWHYMGFSSLYWDCVVPVASSTHGLVTKEELAFDGNYHEVKYHNPQIPEMSQSNTYFYTPPYHDLFCMQVLENSSTSAASSNH